MAETEQNQVVEHPPVVATDEAKAKPAKKAASKSKSVTVYMTGPSRGNPEGQRRRVDPDTAAFLIREKHARAAGE